MNVLLVTSILGSRRGEGWELRVGSRGQSEPRNVGGFQQLEKRREWMLPCGLQKEHSPADDVDFSLSNPFWTSDGPNCKRIHLCCFKPLHVWSLVTSAKGNEYTITSGRLQSMVLFL